jgi:hypothetical protein
LCPFINKTYLSLHPAKTKRKEKGKAKGKESKREGKQKGRKAKGKENGGEGRRGKGTGAREEKGKVSLIISHMWLILQYLCAHGRVIFVILKI